MPSSPRRSRADTARQRRRATRNVDAPRLGLKRLSLGAWGLMADEVESEEDVVVVGREQRGRRGRKKRGRESLSANKVFGREELERQTREIARDKENIHVRTVCIFLSPSHTRVPPFGSSPVCDLWGIESLTQRHYGDYG